MGIEQSALQTKLLQKQRCTPRRRFSFFLKILRSRKEISGYAPVRQWWAVTSYFFNNCNYVTFVQM